MSAPFGSAKTDLDAKIRLLRNEIAIREARQGFLPYLRLMAENPRADNDFSQSVYAVKKHHEYLVRIFEAIERGEYDGKIILISLPPRAGKSHLAKNFVSWYSGLHPERHLIYATYNDNFAKDIGVEVRGLLTSKRHKRVFPEYKFKKGAGRSDYMVTYANGQIKFTGEGGTITGKGGHVLVVDDLFKNDAEADSPTAREKKWSWFNRTFKSRVMDDKTPIIFIATRWHEDDVIGRMTDPENPNYDPELAAKIVEINIPSLVEDPGDPLGREIGEVLWPERFSREYLESLRSADPRGFAALYQGKPTPTDGQHFKREWLRYYARKELPEKLRIYCASDHAISTDQSRDYTVMIVVGVDDKDDIYILDVIWDRMDGNRQVESMVYLMEKWKPLVWWAEKGHITRSIGPFLRKRMNEKGVYVRVEDATPVKDKLSRAQSILARMQMGKVYFPRFAPWVQKAIDQMVKFPNGTYDDFVDAIAWIGLELTRIAGPRSRRAKPAPTSRVGTIAWIKEAHNQRLKTEARRQASKGF